MQRLKYGLIGILCLLAGCDADNKYNTYYPVNFVFYANLYPTCALTRALNSPGDFCIVEPWKDNRGQWHLKLTPNHGQWADSDVNLALGTTIDNKMINYNMMGAGMGLIIGHSNAFGKKCFDLQCPNCLKEQGIARYKMEWTDNGNHLKCSNCNRVYNQDNDDGTIVSGGKKGDNMLIQYQHITYDQTVGRLLIHN